MAFSDISRWAEIMEAQENEKKAYDEACEKCEAEAAELDRKEFEELDEEEIDVETFEMTEAEGKAELADVEEEDEEVDFEAYGVKAERDRQLDEADGREPLAAIAAALGKIASTANLAGEGTARLNESADAEISPNAADVMAALKDFYGKADPNVSYVGAATDGYHRKRVEPAAFSDGVLSLRTKDSAELLTVTEFLDQLVAVGASARKTTAIEFENGAARLTGAEVTVSRGGLRFFTFVGESTKGGHRFFDSEKAEEGRKAEEAGGDALKEAEEEVPPTEGAVQKTDEMKADPDYPLTDADWEEIDSLDSVADKVEAIKNLTGFDRLTGKARENVQADIDFLEGMAKQQEASEKWFKRAAAIQKASWQRELTPAEIKEFTDILNTKLDDFQKTVLLDIPFKEGYHEVFTTHVPKGSEQSGHGAFHGGEDAAERAAETGLDQGFTAENWLNVAEPMAPGEKIQVAFDPKYVSRSDRLADLAKDVRDVSRITKPYYRDMILKDRRLDAARKIAAGRGPEGSYVKGEPKRTLSKDAWKFVRDQVSQEDLDEIRAEVKAGAGTQAEKDFADWMFGDLRVTQKMNAALQGMGGDQSGETGAITQQGTKMQDFILAQLALYLNVAQEEANKMLGVYRAEGVVPGQSDPAGGAKYIRQDGQAANVRKKSEIEAGLANGTILPNPKSARMVREQLREVLFREILEEEGFTPASVASALGLDATPDPNGGVPEIKAAGQVIGFLLQKALVEMTPAEAQEFKDAFATYQTKGQVRKFRTHLTDEQNVEYQDILSRMRRDFDAVPEDQKRRFVVLDRIRRGDDPVQAQAYVDRRLEQLQGKPITTDNFVKIVGKNFLRGGSGNVTKDTITLGDATGER